MNWPRASWRPRLLGPDWEAKRVAALCQVMRGSAKEATTAWESSVQASPMTRSSQSGKVWARTEGMEQRRAADQLIRWR